MLIAGWGSEGGLFFAAVAAFLGSICVFKIRGDYQSTVTKESFLQAAVDGLKYSWNNLSVRRLLSLSIIMETFGRETRTGEHHQRMVHGCRQLVLHHLSHQFR
jgi:hypothetical protein